MQLITVKEFKVKEFDFVTNTIAFKEFCGLQNLQGVKHTWASWRRLYQYWYLTGDII